MAQKAVDKNVAGGRFSVDGAGVITTQSQRGFGRPATAAIVRTGVGQYTLTYEYPIDATEIVVVAGNETAGNAVRAVPTSDDALSIVATAEPVTFNVQVMRTGP